jgi:hypothetical protein
MSGLSASPCTSARARRLPWIQMRSTDQWMVGLVYYQGVFYVKERCPPRSKTASHSRLVIELGDRSWHALVCRYQRQSLLHL